MRHSRYSDNVAGPLYVDDSCIDCNMCRVTAPHHFERNDLGRYTYVTKQPENEAEWALCRRALEECPVNAIGCTVAVGVGTENLELGNQKHGDDLNFD